MGDQIEDLRKIFEHEIKRKLSEKARSPADEFRILMNGFKFYDYAMTGRVNETEFMKSILRTGLSGFNETDIRNLFKYYDKNNAGQMDYKNFCSYLCGREELIPLPNPNNNSIQNLDNNNSQLNPQRKTPINDINIKKQKTPLNQNKNNINSIPPEQDQIISQKNEVPKSPTPVPPPSTNESSQNPNSSPGSEQAKEYFQKLINSLKDQIHTNNGITYYTFLYELKNASDEESKISINALLNGFKSIGVNLPQNDLNNFFNLLDFSNTGKISLDDIINTIVDPLVDHRKYSIVDKFAKFDTEKQGKILISLLKEKYNPKGHPDVINGKISEEEAFKQFCYTLDIYCGIRNIKVDIDYKQFIEYYSGISSSILDENAFIEILNGVWGNDNINMKKNNNEVSKEEIKENNIQQTSNIQNNDINKNINTNVKMDINMNEGYQNKYNQRYTSRRKNIQEPPLKYNESFADSNIGINSVLLGEPTSYAKPRSYGKRSFKKYKYDFSNQDLNNINLNNNQMIDQNKQLINNDINQKNCNISNSNQSMTSQNQILKPKNEIIINYNQVNDPIFNKKRNYRNNFNYNPITNEYTQINGNNYNNNNQENNISAEQMTNNALNKLKNIFISKGPNYIFSYLRKLSLYDFSHSGNVSFDNFVYISRPFNRIISEEELTLIFNYFDKEKKGAIDYHELLKDISGNFSQNKEIIIRKVFESFNKDSSGNVDLNKIKILFNATRHPDVLSGKKNRAEVYGEFLENLETYKDYLENMRGSYITVFSFDDFLNFCGILATGLDNDKMFEMMICNCWNMENIGLNSNKNSEGNLMARAGSQIINNIY